MDPDMDGTRLLGSERPRPDLSVLSAVAGTLGAAGLAFGGAVGVEASTALAVLGAAVLAKAHEARLGQLWRLNRSLQPAAALLALAAVAAAALGGGATYAAVAVVALAVAALVLPQARHRVDGWADAGGEADTVQETLDALARLSEVHDHHTDGHCRRVALDATQVGIYFGLTDDELYSLKWAALLHDLGKSAVPSRVLTKPSALTKSEFDMVKTHCRAGAQKLLSANPAFSEMAEAIAAHHERWDGSGYPVGLAGRAIPLSARIISVVDVFEALTSERPYRKALGADAAIQIIRSGAGAHFDPDVVAVFELLFQRGMLVARGAYADRVPSVRSSGHLGGRGPGEVGSTASLMR
jgi:hypothetical protein